MYKKCEQDLCLSVVRPAIRTLDELCLPDILVFHCFHCYMDVESFSIKHC